VAVTSFPLSYSYFLLSVSLSLPALLLVVFRASLSNHEGGIMQQAAKILTNKINEMMMIMTMKYYDV
jgi:hypothetical protein